MAAKKPLPTPTFLRASGAMAQILLKIGKRVLSVSELHQLVPTLTDGGLQSELRVMVKHGWLRSVPDPSGESLRYERTEVPLPPIHGTAQAQTLQDAGSALLRAAGHSAGPRDKWSWRGKWA